MINKEYQQCLEMILHHEGGYVNHPDDPGGETNLGVTKKVYDAYCKKNGLRPKSMRDLEVLDVAPIYKTEYWDRVKGDDLHPALALCVFDFGVNAGTGRAAKYLQKLVNAKADGAIGPATLRKVGIATEAYGIKNLVTDYQKNRQKYYEKLKHFKTFGRGWTRRVNETTEAALKLIWLDKLIWVCYYGKNQIVRIYYVYTQTSRDTRTLY